MESNARRCSLAKDIVELIVQEVDVFQARRIWKVSVFDQELTANLWVDPQQAAEVPHVRGHRSLPSMRPTLRPPTPACSRTRVPRQLLSRLPRGIVLIGRSCIRHSPSRTVEGGGPLMLIGRMGIGTDLADSLL